MDRASSLLLFATLLSSIASPALAESSAAKAYTPISVSCPAALVRSAGTSPSQQTLGSGEAQYIGTRKSAILPSAWSAYATNVKAQAAAHGVEVPDYVQELLGSGKVPDGLTVGLAISGGGYRAAALGAGVMNAFDGRNSTSVKAGTGGLLQGASYMSGLSGGSWLIAAMTQANFPQPHDLIFGTSSDNSNGDSKTYGGFLASFGLADPNGNLFTEAKYLLELSEEIAGKDSAGFDVTITDMWSRILARHFVNGTTSANFYDYDINHGAGLLWSDVVNVPSLANHLQPFPIAISDSVSPNGNASNNIPEGFGVPISNPIYEFNPYEFGTYDPVLGSFIPTSLLGSAPGKCFKNVDQTSWIQASSSNVFNGAETDIAGKLTDALKALFPHAGTDVSAAKIPNPFVGLAPSTYIDTKETTLALGDGGEDGQEIPFQPLLVKARRVDVIIATDASTDAPNNFAGGTSLIASKARVALFPEAYSFPTVPSTSAEFLANNLTTRPSFFGCNNAGDAPLIIYLANNAPLGEAAVTNTSTWQLSYQSDQLQAMVDQSFDIATQGIPVNVTQKDPEWPTCLACAVVDRARAKAGIARSGVCDTCLTRYCFS